MASTDAGGLNSLLALARETAQEQLASAWRLQIARTEEALRSGWEQHLEMLLAERFEVLGPELERVARERAEAAAGLARQAAARAVTGRLNQTVRRLRLTEKQEEWTLALFDAARESAPRVAVLTVQGDRLRIERASSEAEPADFAIAEAPALDQALRTQETVVAAWSAREISEALAARFGPPAEGALVYAAPLAARGKAIGLVAAAGLKSEVDVDALELISSIAASVWDKRAREAAPELVGIEGAAKERPAAAWADLPAGEQEKHLKAQRFARVQVAEWQLYQSARVHEGRREGSLYRVLREEIDRAREQYREQFLNDGGPMIDYVHVELLRKLANEKQELLGPEYPGPLV